MSGDAQITGEIRIDPPITWAELHAERWALASTGDQWPDAVVKVVWGGDESVYRVVVRDGQAVEVKPTVTWPEDAA